MLKPIKPIKLKEISPDVNVLIETIGQFKKFKQGPEGPEGRRGRRGARGPQGPQGPDGLRGFSGLQGKAGPKGDTGPQGLQGPKGDKGDTGPKGDKGDTGPKGDKGDTGPSPDHEWKGTRLRFKKPNGKWGQPINLLGPAGGRAGRSAKEQFSEIVLDGTTLHFRKQGALGPDYSVDLSSLGGGGGGPEVNDLTVAVVWDNVPDGFITQSSVTQHEAALDHDALTNYLANEHIDWTLDAGASNIHVNNITSVPESAVTAHEAAIHHGALSGLGDDDHSQYLNETRHDALPADNPHGVTLTQAVAADAGTDVTPAELETLTNGGTGDGLHTHTQNNWSIGNVGSSLIDTTFEGAGYYTSGNIPIANGAGLFVCRQLLESDISDFGIYLTAEINDLTAAVTWANVPDANITQSSVTQHQAAIDHDALLNFVSNEHIDWTLDAGASNIHINNITEAAVTQHEAALSIIEAQIVGAAFTNWNTAFGWGDHGVEGYLDEVAHDALAADNPHSVTFSQAVTADAGTDITAAEAEKLSNQSLLLVTDNLHQHGLLTRSATTKTIDASDANTIYQTQSGSFTLSIGVSDTTFPAGATLWMYNLTTSATLTIAPIATDLSFIYWLKNGKFELKIFPGAGSIVLPAGSLSQLVRVNPASWFLVTTQAEQLSGLTDVNTSTPTNRNVLVADGVDWESRALVEADISDLGAYLTSVTPSQELLFEGTLSSATQNTNAASTDYTWNDATEHADITHNDGESVISVDVAGEYEFYFNVELTDGQTNARVVWALYLDHLNSSSVSQFEYMIATNAYTRNQSASYDASAAAGYFNLCLGANEKVVIRSKVLDSSTAGNDYADDTKSYLRIMKKTYA